MTIKKSDYSLSDQALIGLWVTEDLPFRIAAYQTQLDGLTTPQVTQGLLDQLDLYQGIEDIFLETYTSFHTVMVDGFHAERRWLDGDFYQSIITESIIQSTADSPANSLLFPIGYTELDPLQVPDLLGSTDDTRTESEEEGLLEEQDELTPPPVLPDPGDLLAAREKQRDALDAQITALGVLSANLDVGDPGQSNLAFALASANLARTRVVNLISNPSFYSQADRLLQIDDRLNGGSSYLGQLILGIAERVAQIVADSPSHISDRYFWLRRRLNLAFGSLMRLRGVERSVDMIQATINDLQAELDFYVSIGFP